jgi:hypothetical protein
MPRNRWIHYGVLIIAASALIWLGAWFTKRVEWILPYTGVAGAVLIVLGVAMEFRNHLKSRASGVAEGGEPPRQTPAQPSK